MGNNSLYMDQSNHSINNKLYYIPSRRNNIPLVSSPESIYSIHNYINNNINNNNNNNIKNNLNYFAPHNNDNNNDNINKKINSSTIKIIKNNSNIINNNQCYKSNIHSILRNKSHSNENYNKEEQYIKNIHSKNPNIKIIHTHPKTHQPVAEDTHCKKEKRTVDKHKTLVDNTSIHYTGPTVAYPLLSEKNTNNHFRSDKMKSQTSVLSHLPLDSFNNRNETLISPSYITPIYYTSSVPLTATTTTTTTANINGNNASSVVNSYFCDGDERYVVNDNNTITYIVHSNHNEKSIAMTPPTKNNTLINTVTAASSPSSIHNVCYNPPNNNTNSRSSNSNTQVKSLLPMKYYTNSFMNVNYVLNSSPINASTIPTNTTSTNDTSNTQIVNAKSISHLKNSKNSFYTDSIVIKNNDEAMAMNHLQQISNTASTSPRGKPIRNSIDTTTYTNIEKEKVRGPMMYSTSGNNANVMNISPIITNIITSKSSTSNNPQNLIATSAASSTSSSTVSIFSVSSGNSNLVLKDSKLVFSPESTHIHEALSKKAKQTKPSLKHTKKKSTTSLCDKSGIIGFAAEILTSVLPTSNNTLKHPKTRYLPELYPFIKKIAHKCKIDIRTFLYALVYSQRFAEALLSHHKEAVGEYGTNHRIFLGSLLLAYQYQIDHGMKVNFKLDAKKLSQYTDGVWTEKEVEMMCKALLSTKNFTLDINDDVVKQFVETHKADLCWYS